MRVRIDVTERDIKAGVPNNADTCPIAIAAKRVISGEVCVSFKAGIETGKDTSIPLPKKATRFMYSFDNCDDEKVKPFSFTVNAPASVVKKPAKRPAKRGK